MNGWPGTPARQRGVEVLDLPDTAAEVRAAAMLDLERSNRMFGGTSAVLRVVQPLLAELGSDAVVLDVATGTGDIAARIRTGANGRALVVGLDRSTSLLAGTRARCDAAMAGDALALPLRDGSVDLVTCSQALHHFFDEELRQVVRELHRVSRGFVVVSDIRRSHLAAAAFRIGATVFGFHPVTRDDGITSIYRGFTDDELRGLIHDVTGVTPDIRRAPLWRVSATWRTRPRRMGTISAS